MCAASTRCKGGAKASSPARRIRTAGSLNPDGFEVRPQGHSGSVRHQYSVHRNAIPGTFLKHADPKGFGPPNDVPACGNELARSLLAKSATKVLEWWHTARCVFARTSPQKRAASTRAKRDGHARAGCGCNAVPKPASPNRPRYPSFTWPEGASERMRERVSFAADARKRSGVTDHHHLNELLVVDLRAERRRVCASVLRKRAAAHFRRCRRAWPSPSTSASRIISSTSSSVSFSPRFVMTWRSCGVGGPMRIRAPCNRPGCGGARTRCEAARAHLSGGDEAVAVLVKDLERLAQLLLRVGVLRGARRERERARAGTLLLLGPHLHLARHQVQELREVDRAVAVSVHLVAAVAMQHSR